MSSMTTTDNKAFLNELARLVGHSHLSPIRQQPALARASVLVRATRWLSFSLAHYWNCGGC